MLKKIRFIFVLLSFLFLLGNAQAELIKLDWKTQGDGLILRDTSTNLEWLNITVTFDKSVNDLMGQWYGNINIYPLIGEFSEFRYSTKTEITQLYNNFGITTDNIYSPDNVIGANIAFQALGISDTNRDMTLHEAQSIDSPGVLVTASIIAIGYSVLEAKAYVVISNSTDFDYKDSDRGSYLVREVYVVPNPVADAGMDQMVFDEIVLDGSLSSDPDGTIDSFNWQLFHRKNPAYSKTAEGINPTVSDLGPGFYTVILTVTDDDGETDTDEMMFSAIGRKGDLNLDGDVDGDDLFEFAENFGW